MSGWMTFFVWMLTSHHHHHGVIVCEAWNSLMIPAVSNPTLKKHHHFSTSRFSHHHQEAAHTASFSTFFSSSSSTLLFQSSSAANDNDDPHHPVEDPSILSFRIEKCQYADLDVVSDIIMDSFYDGDKVRWRRLLKLAELNRLQQNFPYVDTDLHQMLVAVVAASSSSSSSDGVLRSSSSSSSNNNKKRERTVVGFVDVDARPCKPEIKLPRPYLSDLAVDPRYRRRGIAQALIETCEKFVRNIPRTELYIRVEETNEAAVNMYIHNLDYESRGIELTTDKKRIMTLHKSFEQDRADYSLTTKDDQSPGDDLLVQQPVGIYSDDDESDFVI